MREQLYYHLSNTAGITGIVGTKIYNQLAPNDAVTPYIVYSFTGTTSDYQQSGRTVYRKDVVEINMYSTKVSVCDSMAQAVLTALDIQNTDIGDVGDTVRIFSVNFLTEYDDYDVLDGSEHPIYQITQTHELSYKEA